MVSEKDLEFIRKRRRFVRRWPIVGTLLLLLLAAFVGWLFWSAPLLVNPWAVMPQLEAQSIPDTTLALMAGMLPVAMLMCVGTVVVAICLASVAFANERRMITIVDHVVASSSSVSVAGDHSPPAVDRKQGAGDS